MKVALIHYRLLHRGGLERRLFLYMDWFVRRGDEVSLIVSKIEEGMAVPKGVKVVHLPTRKWPKPVRQLAFDRLVGKHMRENVYDFSLSLGRNSHQDAVLAPGNHRGYLKAMKLKGRSLSDWAQNRLDKRAYRHSPLILAASEMMKREVVEFYHTPEEKVHVLYPPIDTERYHLGVKAQRGAMRLKYDFTPGHQAFLFLSTGHFRKGLPLLLRLWEQIQHLPFELFIAGSPEVKSELPNVRYLGYVKETEELYAAADFVLHPSHYEPYGQVVAEALLCGTPVISSPHTGANEIISPEMGLTAKNYSVKEWGKLVQEAVGRKFHFEADLADRLGLDLEAHMRRMLELAGKA